MNILNIWLKRFKIISDGLVGFKVLFFSVIFLSVIFSLLSSLSLTAVFPVIVLLVGGGEVSGDSIMDKMTTFLLKLFPENPILYIIITYLILLLLITVLTLLNKWLQAKLLHGIRNRWRQQLFSNYMKSNYKAYLKHNHGTIYHNCIMAPEQASNAINSITTAVVQLIQILFLVVLLIIISWQLTIVLSILGILLIALPSKSIAKAVKRIAEKHLIVSQELSQVANESVSGFKELILYNKSANQIHKFNKKSISKSRLLIRYKVFIALPNFVKDLMTIVIGSIGIILIDQIHLDLISIIPALGTYAIVGRKLVPLALVLINSRLGFSNSLPSLKLIFSIINSVTNIDEVDVGSEITTLNSDIIINSLSFGYNKNDGNVISDYSFTIPKEKMTAIIGTSGVGKTTFVNLLVGLFSNYSGSIRLNGIELRDFSKKSLRSIISFVAQDPVIFNCSIRDNILMGKVDATEKELVEALTISHCKEFVEKMDNGIDTIVGEKGSLLSGGQRQRLAIARAVIRKPQLYIFDEATSALDNTTEKFIQTSIEQISKTSTVIVIAHRMSTIENADVVIDFSELKRF